ncbi:MAG: DUF930 domain-containing protein [Pseudomonadota bacterium]
MQQTLKRFADKITPGIIASASIHAIIVLLLIFGLPQLALAPQEPETIQVQLISPEALQQEEEEQEEQHTESEPEPVPETEETAETATEPPPGADETASAEQALAQPLRTLRPVYLFGEEDAGSEQSEDGSSPDGAEADADALSEDQADDPATPEPIIEAEESTDVEVVAAPEAEEEPQQAEETSETALSLIEDQDEVATTAINQMPRGIRAGELCASALRLRLLGGLPEYWPDLIPTYRLDEGTVLQVRRGAFRSNARWYNLEFRCEIDEAATRVVAFDFDVGDPVPRADWASRGLPES